MAEAQRMQDGLHEDIYKDMICRLVPYYQPILALDTRRIMGYEALGRIRVGEGVRSVGPFFADKTVPMAEQIRVDRNLREQALAKFAASDPEYGKLFINLKPSWIYQTYVATGELPTLQLLDKYKIDPRRVVIEITEESFLGPMEQLRAVVDLYRDYGCLIAIDDVGSGFSSIDRIAQIQPHILKIDIHMLQKSERHSGYYGVMRSFSTLADQIGASLLVEGVETEQDLQRAIEIGARYVQGYLFSPAVATFRPALSFAGLLEAGLDRRRTRMLHVERHWSAEAERLQLAIDQAWKRRVGEHDSCNAGDDFIEELLEGLVLADSPCIRLYLCNKDGIQVSSNYQRLSDGGWSKEPHYRGHNWSWRPYFIPLSAQFADRPQAMVSQTYTDLDSFDRIRTLSVPVGGSCILFLDAAELEGER
ncbi:EAL domain-containing protein [Paenibacillus sp. BC26]|uniref:EAL domain-containing protein n=1 Tax=Paenibacillus sp. BC26 TaxID=1881032 RepID=UPI0008E43051|nr:EAL domain-containing protein [Paenibacillus sp. BC26]SFT27390.1 EAL domain, c-di-GMP-specific phosphodiesterase class I (or its enzymatically inactive variant) [Paenibacillus sp. BC26]